MQHITLGEGGWPGGEGGLLGATRPDSAEGSGASAYYAQYTPSVQCINIQSLLLLRTVQVTATASQPARLTSDRSQLLAALQCQE